MARSSKADVLHAAPPMVPPAIAALLHCELGTFPFSSVLPSPLSTSQTPRLFRGRGLPSADVRARGPFFHVPVPLSLTEGLSEVTYSFTPPLFFRRGGMPPRPNRSSRVIFLTSSFLRRYRARDRARSRMAAVEEVVDGADSFS